MKDLPIYIRILLILTFAGAFIGSWAWTLNQVTHVWDAHRLTEVRAVEAACAAYGIPHALVTAERSYCFAVVNGTEQMIPLDTLDAYYKKGQ